MRGMSGDQASQVRVIRLREWMLGGKHPFFLIAGPCVIESESHSRLLAGRLKEITSSLQIPFIFKASYDKANRTSIHSYRGPGLEEGLRILQGIRRDFEIPVTSDVHDTDQAGIAGEVLDLIQIPAFLCRQTDLLTAAARTGSIVNVKKGQFLAPWDARNIVDKLEAAGCRQYMITERGSSFGYNNLVVDFKSLPAIRSLGCPVVFDATHSVQLPGGKGDRSSGQAEYIPFLAAAAAAVGVDGLFLEVHDRPEEALSDGANSLRLEQVPALLEKLLEIENCSKSIGFPNPTDGNLLCP